MSDNDPIQVTIWRELWYRGQGSSSSRLVRPGEGKRCCLGFAGIACGIPIRDLVGITDPADTSLIVIAPVGGGVIPAVQLFASKLVLPRNMQPSATCNKLMAFNDAGLNETMRASGYHVDTNLQSEAERETKLAELALEAGFVFTFEDLFSMERLAKFAEGDKFAAFGISENKGKGEEYMRAWFISHVVENSATLRAYCEANGFKSPKDEEEGQ